MNVKYKKSIMGLLLLVQFPAAIANSGIIFNVYRMATYQECSLRLLDDNSVEVSFNVSIVEKDQIPYLYHQTRPQFPPPAGYESMEEKQDRLLNILQRDKISPYNALLSLYFYHADGTRDLTIQLNEIRIISLNGIIPSGSQENTQELQFDSRSMLPNDYNVFFNIPANKLKNISIAARVGYKVGDKDQSYSLLSSDGVSFSPDGKSCRSFNPQAAIAPEALKIDPEFRMDSAVWELAPLDLDELLDKTANNHGLPALFNPPKNNRFCLHYRSIATRNKSYRISASNINGLAPNNQYFQLKEKNGSNFINYKVGLRSNENAGADFELPKDKKYIQLKSDDNQVMSDMCWEPNITLFSTDTTDEGSYSDTLNFTITPMA
ncbi:hypothetical protein ACS78Q_18340 [Yersinia enterocolitica]|uniref:hypothetical protein n=1 Tax=Yersinia enterocolitica TaxID=630 RepID=UPI002AC501E0|nr:hypothetical protein [Yersinia enterocolitica]